MKSDSDIRRDVETELQWEPTLDSRDIGIAVKDGVVTLSGAVRSYAERRAAEDASKRIAGVVGLANDIAVVLPRSDEVPDPDIAHAASLALRTHLGPAAEGIRPIVSQGSPALEGEVAWGYQRQGAEIAVRHLKGVRAVENRIKVRPTEPPDVAGVRQQIEEAFKRHAAIDAHALTITIKGETLILGGVVGSWIERDEAERIALAAPGIAKVENRIAISA
jgi:osmotically-inducible protein OsmY